MPLYEYDCSACGKPQELIRRFSEADNKTCPECGAEGLERRTSKTAFQLKGGGWYADGYSSEAPSCDTAKAGGCANGACAANPS
ncbi:MAG: zinc ribbon domain-containing protein [bacterium]|nr:zinc ribbon domain-containing protein [bacterium]